MRMVIGMEPALRAHACKAAAPGTPRLGTAYCTTTLFLRSVRVVSVDDPRDERVAHDVLRAELREGDAAHAFQDAARLDEAALVAARQVDLGHIAVDHRLGAEADAGEEHLHLLGRRVL